MRWTSSDLIIETGTRKCAAIHFRENTLNCQDAKSNLGSAKGRDKRPGRGLWPYPQCGKTRREPALCRSIRARGPPQRQHAIETRAVDRLGHAGLLDLARNRTEAERIERNPRRRSQESQVAEPRP